MLNAGLWADGLVNAMAAGAFLLIGMALLRRSPAPSARAALTGFASFWILYGVNLAFASWRILRVAAGSQEVLPFVVLFVVETGIAAVALYGLFLYVLFIRQGNYNGHLYLLGATFALAIALGAIVVGHSPNEVVVEDWRADLTFEKPLEPLVRWGMVVTYYGALLGAAAAMVALSWRAELGERVRAGGLAFALVLLALMDAIILGPDHALPGGYLATTGKVVAVSIVGGLYLKP